MDKEIPASRGRRFKSENIDINKTVNFDLPPRDPGRIPSLPRPLAKEKKSEPIQRVPPRDMKLKVEQELATANSKLRPVPPISPKAFPTKEEKVPNLSELI